MVNVCDIQVMKPLLAEHGFHFSKAKGQNFLIAPWVPQSIAEEAGVDETAGVLEIGPGIGPLTQQLCLRVPVLLPGKSHGQRNLVGCSPWGREESDMTE